MFVFLALVFGLGFVILGIGSDKGPGIGALLRPCAPVPERSQHQTLDGPL